MILRPLHNPLASMYKEICNMTGSAISCCILLSDGANSYLIHYRSLGLVNITNNPRTTLPKNHTPRITVTPIPMPMDDPTCSASLRVSYPSVAALIPPINQASMKKWNRINPHLNILPKNPRFTLRSCDPQDAHL